MPELTLNVDQFILDGRNPGSGETFGWQALNETKQELSRCLLAGGLNEKNIGQAVELLRSQELFGLDLNSGVETRPGVKSREKLNNVFAQIRNY